MPDKTAKLPQPRERLVPDLSTKPFGDDDILDEKHVPSDTRPNDDPTL